MNHLDKLENKSIHILREAYRQFPNLCMLWSIGKDSTVLLWLARKAFFGHVPMPLVHIDTHYKIPEMIVYRDKLALEWKLDMVYGENTDVYDADGTDPDNGDNITWSISGTDAALFDIDSSTGEITFKVSPNYESSADSDHDNVYNITVTATDGGGLVASSNVAVTVTDVNEAPVITSGTSAAFTEGGTGTVYTAAASDPEGDAITWSIGGTDAGLFTIDSSTGILTFKAPPSYSSPADDGADNVYDITVTAEDSGGQQAALNVAVTVTARSGGNGHHSSSSTTPSTPTSTPGGITVNGREQDAGTFATTAVGDTTVMTVVVDDSKLESILSSEDRDATVTISFETDTDVVVGQLNGQMVKIMENKEAVLEINTGDVIYSLPTSQINISHVAEQLGNQLDLQDILVNITIYQPPQNTVTIIEDTADQNHYQIVVPPVQFDITCTYGGKTVAVSEFNAYVERLIAIPEEIDPNRITTGIILNPDGTFSHVPTQIIQVDGKYYAKISSLTNSVYSVIWNPQTFKDVEEHWAKAAVNDMGSRLILSGTGDENFTPDRDITRAEFAAILVRGLGLMQSGAGQDTFDDISAHDWYYDAVSIAYEYGLISGLGNDVFGPMTPLTREQAMVMAARAMQLTGLQTELTSAEVNDILQGFTDGSQSSDWARAGIAACVKAGVVAGEPGGTIAPQDKITRAEVAVIVQRLLQKSGLI